jgi:hypothetical protein
MASKLSDAKREELRRRREAKQRGDSPPPTKNGAPNPGSPRGSSGPQDDLGSTIDSTIESAIEEPQPPVVRPTEVAPVPSSTTSSTIGESKPKQVGAVDQSSLFLPPFFKPSVNAEC